MSCNCNPYALREKYAGFFTPIKKHSDDPEKEMEKKLKKKKNDETLQQP